MTARDEPWQIDFDHFDPADERRREALLALGNGLLYCRASAPEAPLGHAEHYAGLYWAGWYDQAPRRVNGVEARLDALVNLPAPFGLSVSLDQGAHWLGPDSVERHDYHQRLDFGAGLLERQLRLTLHGQPLSVTETRLVSMAQPRLALLRWVLQLPPGVTRVRLRSVLEAGVSNALVPRNAAFEGSRLKGVELEHLSDGHAAASARLDEPTRQVAVATFTEVAGQTLRWEGRTEGRQLVQECDCAVPDDGRLILDKRVLVQVAEDSDQPSAAIRARALKQLPEQPVPDLTAAHVQAWRELWTDMPLASEDAALQRALRLHAFHLLQVVSPHSCARDQGFPPRAWQEGYYGQVFWDELFAFPFLSTHFPALALGLLRYRHARLPVARERARRAGLRGAMFPWRSGRTGEEQTPPFQCNPLRGHWMADHTHLQRHVGSAIAFDAWQVFLATGEVGLLAREGGELILEIARFWASLAQRDGPDQRYHIRRVIGPDEYHNAYPDAPEPGLDDNAYTNLMAGWTLCRALDVLEVLPAEAAAGLRRRLGLNDRELAHWNEISRRLYLPLQSDGSLGQFEGFERLAEPPRGWLEGERPRLDWWLDSRGDSTDRYQLTKQGDVLMLLHLFPPAVLCRLLQRLDYPFDEALARRTIDRHLAHITHESSLSQVVCAGALAHVDGERSWRYFQQCLRTDLDLANAGTVEGVHLGAMAGSLDVLQRHYLGLQPGLDGLHVDPAVPPGLRQLDTALCYRGAWLEVSLAGDCLALRSRANNPGPVRLILGDGEAMLAPGECRELALAGGHLTDRPVG